MGMRGGDTLAKTAAIQQFSRLEKAGGRVEPLGCTPQKNHPQKDAISIRQPACTKKREMVLHFRSKTFVKTISSSRPFLRAQFGICLFTFRAAEGELQLPPTESRNVCRSMLVGNPA